MKAILQTPYKQLSGTDDASLVNMVDRWGNPIVRTYVVPFNPDTTKQQEIRANFTTNSVAWAALTDVQRNAWNSLGSSLQRTNSIGQEYFLSGINAYKAVNSYNLLQNQAASPSAPLAEDVNILTDITAVAFVSATGVLTVTAAFAADTTSNIQVRVTPTLSDGALAQPTDFRLPAGAGTLEECYVIDDETGPGSGPVVYTFTAPEAFVASWVNGGTIGVELVMLSPLNVPFNEPTRRTLSLSLS